GNSTFAPVQEAVGMQQHLEESLREMGILRGMATFLQERDRRVDLNGYRPDLHDDSQTVERIHVLSIEVRDRLRPQRDTAASAVARVDDEAVRDQIELGLEAERPVRDWRGDQTARANVQRHVPPVILMRG